MTIYVNHNNPNSLQDVTMQIIRAGVAGQITAENIAHMIIRDRLTTWRGINIVHYG